MKEPLTENYYKKEVQPKIKDKSGAKKLLSHLKGTESLEKAMRADPLDPAKVKLVADSLRNVRTCALALKAPDRDLKQEIDNIAKATRTYVKEHNNKFVGKISTQNIGSIPGGMKKLTQLGMDDFSPVNMKFRVDTQKVDPKNSSALLKIWSNYKGRINVPASDISAYNKAAQSVIEAIAGLKEKAKRGKNDPEALEKREQALKLYHAAVANLAKTTRKVRMEMVHLQRDTIHRFTGKLFMRD